MYRVYFGRRPELVTTDLDMIKAITIKDFNHFIDRRVRTLYKIYSLKNVFIRLYLYYIG